jgi:hypothetical protein
MTRDRELWALALWVEKHHRADGPRFIAERVGEAALAGDQLGIDLWRAVAERGERLRVGEGAPS